MALSDYSYENLKAKHAGKQSSEAGHEVMDSQGTVHKAYGTMKGPGGEDINPLTKVAYADDIVGVASGVESIKWGAAQLNRGIAQAKGHKASIVGMAKANIFEFPVFISDSVPLEYATATNTLLEQVYAAYLQVAISINPVVPSTLIKERQGKSPFAKYKTNTSDYVECVDLTFQKDACHNIIFNDDDGTVFEYNMCSIEDADARIMLEAVDYQPLSEFDHYFQEAKVPVQKNPLYGFVFEPPYVDSRTGLEMVVVPRFDSNGKPETRAGGKLITISIPINDPADPSKRSQAYTDAIANFRKYNSSQTIPVEYPDGTIHNLTPDQLAKESSRTDVESSMAEHSAKSRKRKDVKRSSNETGYEAEDRGARHRANVSEREDSAAAKKLNEFIENGKLKNFNELDGSERKEILGVFDVISAAKEYSAERESIKKMKAKLESGQNLGTAECVRLSKYLTTKKQLREEEEAGERYEGKTRADWDRENTAEKAKLSRQQREDAEKTTDIGGQKMNQADINRELTADELKQKRRLEEALGDIYDPEKYNPDSTRGQLTKYSGESDAHFKARVQYARELYKKRCELLDELEGTNNINDLRAVTEIRDLLGKQADSKMKVEKLNDYLAFKQKYKMSPEEAKEAREARKERFETKASKAPQFLDENKIKKMNTMKPLMMTVTMSIMADDGHVSHPMEYVVGVKTHCRIVKSSMLPEVVEYPVKEMNKITRKAKWRAGELKFFKDILFHVKEKKQTAIDSRDPNRKWYRRLYELAHMKGDGNVSKKIAGAGAVNGLIPNATVIMSKSDVDNVEEVTGIDMLKASTAINFCEQLFLIGFVVIDIDNESIKVLIPEVNNEFDVQSLAAVNKQIAELDTAGKSTRDVFKMLK